MSAENANLPPGANNLPDAQSQMVVTMFAPPGTPLLTVVSAAELAERRHLRFTRHRRPDVVAG